jgi:hypothetical protein
MKTLPTLYRTALPSSPADRKLLDETVDDRMSALRKKDSDEGVNFLTLSAEGCNFG